MKTLSNISLDVDGLTADTVIKNRVAQRARIETLRTSRHFDHRNMFSQFRELELIAASFGYLYDYDETLQDTDDDIGF